MDANKKRFIRFLIWTTTLGDACSFDGIIPSSTSKPTDSVSRNTTKFGNTKGQCGYDTTKPVNTTMFSNTRDKKSAEQQLDRWWEEMLKEIEAGKKKKIERERESEKLFSEFSMPKERTNTKIPHLKDIIKVTNLGIFETDNECGEPAIDDVKKRLKTLYPNLDTSKIAIDIKYKHIWINSPMDSGYTGSVILSYISISKPIDLKPIDLKTIAGNKEPGIYLGEIEIESKDAKPSRNDLEKLVKPAYPKLNMEQIKFYIINDPKKNKLDKRRGLIRPRSNYYTGEIEFTYSCITTKLKKAYETLKIQRNATWEEVKKAFKKLIRKAHPDKYINGCPTEDQGSNRESKKNKYGKRRTRTTLLISRNTRLTSYSPRVCFDAKIAL